MKYSALIIALFISFTASAQSALNLSWVMHPNLPDKGTIRYYLHNDGNHPVRVTGFRASVSFDTAASVWLVKSNPACNIEVSPWTKENNLDYFEDIWIRYIGPEDSLSMERGNTVLILTVNYWDEYQKENRIYTVEMTLKDHRSWETLTDKVIYKEDKKEN